MKLLVQVPRRFAPLFVPPAFCSPSIPPCIPPLLLAEPGPVVPAFVPAGFIFEKEALLVLRTLFFGPTLWLLVEAFLGT